MRAGSIIPSKDRINFRWKFNRQSSVIQTPGGDIWLSHSCENRHSGRDRIRDARQQAISFGFGSAKLIDNDQVHVGIDGVRNAMRNRRETARVELAAARFTAAILCDAFCFAGPDVDDIELSTASVRTEFGLLKNATDHDAFLLQAFDDLAEGTVDVKVSLILNCSKVWWEIS